MHGYCFLSRLYMFRATNSPIFRSIFHCIYSFWYKAPILLFKSALHVSGDKLAHPQEHFLTVHTAFGTVYLNTADQ